MGLTRRSNAERSEQTRNKIIQSTIDCVHQYGYQGATMAVIAKSSGVTRGALQHHFGNKRVDLIIEAAECVYNEYYAEYLPLLRENDIESLMSDIWQLQKKLFKQRGTIVLIQIWLASLSDKELSDRLVPLFKTLDGRLSSEWRRCFSGSNLSDEKIQTIRYLQRTLLRGAAIEYLMLPEEDVFDRLFDVASLVSKDIISI